MKIIKEYRQSMGKHKLAMGIIRSNTYAHSFAYISKLIQIAVSDFPSINYRDIQIKVYNDRGCTRMTGIEFTIPTGVVVLKDYESIVAMPKTFN